MDIKQALREMLGKEIVFDTTLKYTIDGNIIDSGLLDSEFRIVYYVESNNCFSCMLKLSQWMELIDEFNTLVDSSFDFILIINSESDSAINQIIRDNGFHLPIVFDKNNVFCIQNNIPANQILHTFLIDGDNKIVAIGNPLYNKQTKDLYINILTRKRPFQSLNDSTLFDPYKESTYSLGLIPLNTTSEFTSTLYNETNDTLTVIDVIPSCDCISVASFYQLIPHRFKSINISYTPKESGAFRQSVDVYYKDKSKPERITFYGVVNNHNY